MNKDPRWETHPSMVRLHVRATELGWRCLSHEWTGRAAFYVFECANGHRSERVAAAFLDRTPRCIACRDDEIRTRCLENVAAHGGIMLDPFKGLQERHRLRCASGHEWTTLGIHTSNGKWCPLCAREQRALARRRSDGLEKLQAVAAARGGRCLTDTYTGGRERYLFECAKGHRWEATGSAVIRKTWCRRCSDAEVGPRAAKALTCRDGLERLHDAARKHGGECLSSEYTNQRAKYRFRCAAGHEWTQTANAILQGSWCASCAHLAQRTSIETLQEIAESRGGKCLSSQRVDVKDKLTWQCAMGHVWQANPINVKSGQWCPKCARAELSEDNAQRFASARARASADPSDPRLRKLQEIAAELGWRCVSQGWVGEKTQYDFECAKGHRLKRHASHVMRGKKSIARCEECQAEELKTRWLDTVNTRGGVLLGVFTGLNEKYRLRCASGHEWETLGTVIRQGSWCPQCAQETSRQAQLKTDGLERLQAMAADRGGRCLADTYLGSTGFYPFECALGHGWEATGNTIVQGSWCPKCAHIEHGDRVREALLLKDGLLRLQETARQRNGECLSTEYTGNRGYYRFRCILGHEWTQRAASVWQGQWCKRCANLGRRTLTIGKLREIAKSRGGECLSAEIGHSTEKLEWRCRLGHVWKALPHNINQGRWCPNCAMLDRTKNARKRKRYDFEGTS
jgi:hypothetical protein